MDTNTDYLDAQDKIDTKVAQLSALLSLIIATENKCLDGEKRLTKENVLWLAGGLADDIDAAVTVIYQAECHGPLSAATVEALCFKASHLCGLFDVLNTHLQDVERMNASIQQNLIWLAGSLVDDIGRLVDTARQPALKVA